MKFKEQTHQWLLEKDNPTVRYLTLKNLVRLEKDDPELKKAHKESIKSGVIAKILSKMKPEGYWVKEGAGYSPKYKSTVWSLIALSQIGAKVKDDPRIKKASEYYLDHAFCEGDFISYNGGYVSYKIDCLQGNMCAALTDLEFSDKRIGKVFNFLTAKILNIEDTKGKLKPLFYCKYNDDLSCAWGATKVMLAFSKLPKNKLTPIMKKAIEKGSQFFLDLDLVLANFPTRNSSAPNKAWWKLGFPVFYITDILQVTEALINLGYKKHPKVKKAIEFILEKQNKEGSWNLEYNYKGKTWVNWGETGKPNKWVTYRVLKALI